MSNVTPEQWEADWGKVLEAIGHTCPKDGEMRPAACAGCAAMVAISRIQATMGAPAFVPEHVPEAPAGVSAEAQRDAWRERSLIMQQERDSLKARLEALSWVITQAEQRAGTWEKNIRALASLEQRMKLIAGIDVPPPTILWSSETARVLEGGRVEVRDAIGEWNAKPSVVARVLENLGGEEALAAREYRAALEQSQFQVSMLKDARKEGSARADSASTTAPLSGTGDVLQQVTMDLQRALSVDYDRPGQPNTLYDMAMTALAEARLGREARTVLCAIAPVLAKLGAPLRRKLAAGAREMSVRANRETWMLLLLLEPDVERAARVQVTAHVGAVGGNRWKGYLRLEWSGAPPRWLLVEGQPEGGLEQPRTVDWLLEQFPDTSAMRRYALARGVGMEMPAQTLADLVMTEIDIPEVPES